MGTLEISFFTITPMGAGSYKRPAAPPLMDSASERRSVHIAESLPVAGGCGCLLQAYEWNAVLGPYVSRAF